VADNVDKTVLFVAKGGHRDKIDLRISLFSFSKITRDGILNEINLLKYLDDLLNNSLYIFLLISLRVLVTIFNIYKMLPNATSALSVTSQALYKMSWIPKKNT
jgi:hypothetical protein